MTAERPAVIVVEDEPQIRGVLRVMLEGNGFRCIEAESARRDCSMQRRIAPI